MELGASDEKSKYENNSLEKQHSNISCSQKILLPLGTIVMTGILLKCGYNKYKSLKIDLLYLHP